MNGKSNDNDFVLDQRFKTDTGTVHYNIRMPDHYDQKKRYALHIALPGWEGMYFQGVGKDLRYEYLPDQSTKYIRDMIVVSVQENSQSNKTVALQVIGLTKHLIRKYHIDEKKVYLTGYSFGGEVLSHVLSIEPSLYRRALFVSSRWDADMRKLVASRVPLYIFVSVHDSYYGSAPAKSAGENLQRLYEKAGIQENKIKSLIKVDIRDDSWFNEFMEKHPKITKTMYESDQHGAGMLVAYDENVMKWVFR